MTDKKPDPLVQFVTQTESVRLTNASIRVTWKISNAFIAIVARLSTGIALAAVRRRRRDRDHW